MNQPSTFSSKYLSYAIITLFALLQGLIIAGYAEGTFHAILSSNEMFFYLPAVFAIFLPTAFSYLIIHPKSPRLYAVLALITILILWIFFWHYINQFPSDFDESLVFIIFFTLITLLFFLLPWLQLYTAHKTFKIQYQYLIKHYVSNVLFGGIACGISGLLILLIHLAAYLFDLIGLEMLNNILLFPWVLWLLFFLSFNLSLFFLRTTFEIEINRICSYIARLFLPLLNLITLIFLIGLIFTDGIEINSTIMLALTGASIILINLVYEDGSSQYQFPKGLNSFILLNILLLNAFSILSIYGITTRVLQYSFSIGRLYALTLCLFFALLILSYSVAILRKRRLWMQSLSKINTIFLLLIAGIVLTINSPLVNFYKISANSILRGVEKGAIPINYSLEYDLQRLGKQGYRALEVIKNNPKLQSLTEMTTEDKQALPQPKAPSPQETFDIAQKSNPIPDSWWATQNDNHYCTESIEKYQCLVLTQDMNQDGSLDVVSCFLRKGSYPWISCKTWQENVGSWREVDQQSFSFDSEDTRNMTWQKLLEGNFSIRPKEWYEIHVNPDVH